MIIQLTTAAAAIAETGLQDYAKRLILVITTSSLNVLAPQIHIRFNNKQFPLNSGIVTENDNMYVVQG